MIPPNELDPPRTADFQLPAIRVWFYAGPIIIDALAIICTTILVALQILPVENFKYLVGVLVVGNVALRMPGTGKMVPPGGGGLIMAIVVSAVATLKGFRS